MSLHEELRAAQRCVDDLARCVSRLERELGGVLEVRRVRSDADHLRESLELLGAASVSRPPSPARAGEPAAEPIRVPDAPYDHRLWVGADDEGLGCHRP
ncbi:hypothetical protein [Streptomyces sp. 6N223]|uniref:hypothetical protein n=1 Tax=Streptomyces sp. 6N223 TaxID=3457412 RepID=UPI003FD2BA38